MSDNPYEGPDWEAFAKEAVEGLYPKVQSSVMAISLLPDGPPDVKIALEMGFMVLLDKPIIAVVRPGTEVPNNVIKVAEEIVELDMADPAQAQRLRDAIDRVMKRQQEKGV